ncbi:hypothetical protein F5Y16DRAFT_82639 [Xylariaceae sp. FL0255]|nr:hypothetical protein F5Y16DRAFT_82639 [Xylariaceae sp. FL0255]
MTESQGKTQQGQKGLVGNLVGGLDSILTGGDKAQGQGGALGGLNSTVGKTTEGVGSTLNQTTEGVGNIAGSATEGVGNVAGSATEGVSNTVGQTTDTLGHTVEGVLGSGQQQERKQ